MRLLLASQSPRRRELLEGLGYSFESVKIDVEEIFPKNILAQDVPAYLSELKSKAFRNLDSNEILLTADTVVINDNKILGKPDSEAEAKQMILAMSGKSHQVVTAVSFRTSSGIKTFSDTAEVFLDEISEEEAEFYVKNFRPLDKAGAYGIQEWFGMAKIKSIHGTFYTIMGLPTHLVHAELRKYFPIAYSLKN